MTNTEAHRTAAASSEMKYPPSEPSKEATSDPKKATPPAPSRKGRLTFLVPTGIQGDKELEWIGEAQAILLKEAKEAKAEWSRAHDAFLHGLDKDVSQAFNRLATDRLPRFDELTPEVQQMAGQFFGQGQANALGREDWRNWLAGSQTIGFAVEPILEIGIGTGNPQDGIGIVDVQFNCPIGP